LSRLDEISKYINQLSYDLKAEMLVAVLAEHRIDLREILAAFDGQLKRTWSRDIDWSAVDHFETGDVMLSLHLNRDGIYDVLPEVLFHSSYGNEDQSAKDMAKDSMQMRSEEKETRSFFQPFENEFFLQRVQLAMIENQLFKNLDSQFLTAMISHFWMVDQDLPENYVDLLKKMLPLVHQITGDFDLTAQCLEFILKERVRIYNSGEDSDDVAQTDFHLSGVLNESLLGINTITGNLNNSFANRLICSIGPIIQTETSELVKNGTMDRFLDCFYSYFIPFELEVDTKYIFGSEQSLLLLNDNSDVYISYLGYNSVIV
jgi:hypothetical protein